MISKIIKVRVCPILTIQNECLNPLFRLSPESVWNVIITPDCGTTVKQAEAMTVILCNTSGLIPVFKKLGKIVDETIPIAPEEEPVIPLNIAVVKDRPTRGDEDKDIKKLLMTSKPAVVVKIVPKATDEDVAKAGIIEDVAPLFKVSFWLLI